MTTIDHAQRLEAERLRPVPRKPGRPNPAAPAPDYTALDVLFRDLIGLIAAECSRAGMLPKRYAR